MPKAVAGGPYTIVSGDTLSEIAKQAYGDGRRWREIWQANEGVLKSGDPNLIFPGETINIPGNILEETVSANLLAGSPLADALPVLPDKDPDAFTVIVDDLEIPVISGRSFRAVDTAADGWSVLVNLNEADNDLLTAVRPYGYQSAINYLGGQLICSGYLYTVAPSLRDSKTIQLEGWSFTVDAIDSTSKAPYEQEGVTLEQRARHLVEPLGIRVVYDAPDQTFKRVVIGSTEKIFDHLAKLAVQLGVLITSTERGELKFTQAADTKPIGTIEETIPLPTAFDARFDGRKRFNVYKALSQTPARKNKKKNESKIQIAKDNMVPRSRSLAFTVDETDAGQMKLAAEWRRSKQLADSLTIPFPVSSWYGPDGKLWKENTIVTVKSPTIFVPDGFDFLIRSVEYIYTDKGTDAILGLVPPQVFTGEKIDEPWASSEIRTLNLIDRVVGAI